MSVEAQEVTGPASWPEADPGRPTLLYRLYDADDQLLYVGISVSIHTRFAEHSASKPWWPAVSRVEFERHALRGLALIAEANAIRTEKPIHNIVHSTLPVETVSGRRQASPPAPSTPVLPAEELKETADRLRQEEEKVADLRVKIRGIIRQQLEAGVTQADIVRVTGYTRETIRKIAKEQQT